MVLAGAVQDMLVLFLSMRRDGRSLGDMIRSEMGAAAGVIAMVGILMIMVILLAVLALVVVKALAHQPVGHVHRRDDDPDRAADGRRTCAGSGPAASSRSRCIGLVLLLLSIWIGGKVAAIPEWAPLFTFDGKALAWMLIGYGFVAAVLPVWMLLAPRDYLSTFLKIGTVRAARGGDPVRDAGPADAGGDALHRRQRAGVRRQAVPVPVHHHRLRRGVRASMR